MVSPQHRRSSDEVDQLMLNARLRDELEPFVDESLALLDSYGMSTPAENEYLASMLAWERAPVLPISHWFQPELRVPPPDTLDDPQLHQLLWYAIEQLYEKQIVLEFTDHLSDRELYRLIYRDILPSLEKKLDRPHRYIHWHCLDSDDDPDIWLAYYASDEEREEWAEHTGQVPPPVEPPPFPRRLPGTSR